MRTNDPTALKTAVLWASVPPEYELDEDCACPERPAATITVQDFQGVFSQTPNCLVQELTPDFKLLYSPFAPYGPSVVNQDTWRRWRAFTEPMPLTEPIDRQLAHQGLLSMQNRSPVLQTQITDRLSVWMHVTNACNLECPYCYIRKSSERMTEEVGLRALEQVFETARMNQFRRIKLKYAGGEASLHFALIRTLHTRAGELAREQQVQLSEVILTNGTRMRPQDADWIAENHVKVMVSLDGVGEMHNQLRRFKGGGESFTHIVNTIDGVLTPRGIIPDITITVTQLNALGIDDAVRWALARNLPVSLNFYRQNILSQSHHELALEENTIIQGMKAAYAVFEDFLPERSFFNGLLDRVQGEAHSHTCGVGLSYLVISHQGKLAQCQMHLASARHIEQSNLLPLVHQGEIHNLSVNDKPICRECTYRYRCAGGCPLEVYRATGRWDLSSPNCHIYKTLLPEALRLEGLRLLRVHGCLN